MVYWAGRQMVHLNLWFSFKDATTEPQQFQRVKAFLDDLKDRGKVHSYRLMNSRHFPQEGVRPRFHVLVMFPENQDWMASVVEVQSIGIHQGRHGFMIEDVCDFATAVSEDLPESGPSN